MNDGEITRLLKELQGKLENAKALSESDRELLRRLADDIESLLARSRSLAVEHRRSIVARLQESIAFFEVSHPDLTNVLARVSKTLADLGI